MLVWFQALGLSDLTTKQAEKFRRFLCEIITPDLQTRPRVSNFVDNIETVYFKDLIFFACIGCKGNWIKETAQICRAR
jgi:hypothetical protein